MANISKKIITPIVLGMIGVAVFLVVKDVVKAPKEIFPDELIQEVSIRAIIASTKNHGTEVGQDEKEHPPPPYRTRFRIKLNKDILDELSTDEPFGFDGTLIHFRDLVPDQIEDIIVNIMNDKFIEGNILYGDFLIPRDIPNWNLDVDPVVLVVNVALETLTEKATFVLPLATSAVKSVTGERKINDDIYTTEGERNKFRGEFDGTRTRNGLTNGTGVCDPKDPECED